MDPDDSIDGVLLGKKDSKDVFVRSLMTSLVQLTKTSNGLPCDDENTSEYGYYRTFRECSNNLDTLSHHVSDLIKELCYFSRSRSASDLSSVDLSDPSTFETIVDIIDDILEHADLKFDEVSGIDTSKRSYKLKDVVDKDTLMFSNTLDIPKPQERFSAPPDNERDTPFVPILWGKPNAVVPLEKSINRTSHIYETEILLLEYETSVLVESLPTEPLTSPIDCSVHPFEYVETEGALKALVGDIRSRNCSEIAIDLENHSYRSFQGFSCLMQLSTRYKDYIIDTLALREHMGLLLDVFTDSHIVKVFHGCQNDILWLQRDFGLYVVNCFDTYQAAKLLKYPALSLAHLLKYYCGVTVNKKHQLADWRQRPLPAELVNYARDDTHYLLYIYDCLRRDIFRSHHETGLFSVFDASRKTCLLRYEKDPFNRLGYTQLLDDRRSKVRVADLSPSQDSALMCLWDWRDQLAREYDESLTYIMSNAELIRLGTLPRIPKTTEELVQMAQPLSNFTRSRLSVILELLNGALLGKNIKDVIQEDVNSSGRGTIPENRDKGKPGGASGTSRAGINPVRGVSSGVLTRYKETQALPTFQPSVVAPSSITNKSNKSSASTVVPTVPPLGNGLYTGIRQDTVSVGSKQDMISDLNDLLKKVGWMAPKTSHKEATSRAPTRIKTYEFQETPNAEVKMQFESAMTSFQSSSVIKPPTSQTSAPIVPAAVQRIDTAGKHSVDHEDLPRDTEEDDAASSNVPVVGLTAVTEIELPRSLNEVYNLSKLSKKNRTRDRKRNRETFSASDSFNGGVDVDAANTAASSYFNKSSSMDPPPNEDRVNSMMSFLEKVNWVDDGDRLDVAASLSSVASDAGSTKKSSEPVAAAPSGGGRQAGLVNPFLNYSSSDMAAIGTMQSSSGAADSKSSASTRKIVSDIKSPPRSSGSRPADTGVSQKAKPKIEPKRDRDRNIVFS